MRCPGAWHDANCMCKGSGEMPCVHCHYTGVCNKPCCEPPPRRVREPVGCCEFPALAIAGAVGLVFLYSRRRSASAADT